MALKDYTALVLVIDRSGSMQSIASTVEGALEEFVGEQKSLPGKLTIDTVFFNQVVENRASFIDPNTADLDLTIRPSGMTALFDAVGGKIDSFGSALAELDEDSRPERVIFVIATDGAENSSQEYTLESVAERVKHQREVYSWDFTFIGANQDAVLTARGLNIPQESSITFEASSVGADSVLRSMSSYVASSRSGVSAGYSAEDRLSAVVKDEPSDDSAKIDVPRASKAKAPTKRVAKAPTKATPKDDSRANRPTKL